MTDNRLLLQSDVIRIVDKHTNDENVLDNDISCILEIAHHLNIALEKMTPKRII